MPAECVIDHGAQGRDVGRLPSERQGGAFEAHRQGQDDDPGRGVPQSAAEGGRVGGDRGRRRLSEGPGPPRTTGTPTAR